MTDLIISSDGNNCNGVSGGGSSDTDGGDIVRFGRVTFYLI